MSQSVLSQIPGDHHQPMPAVERRHRLREELYRLFVALPGSDKQTRQWHKDIQQGKTKAPDILAAMVGSAIEKREESKVRAIANALVAFCASGSAHVRRRFPFLYRVETKNQGELDNVQCAVEQGDLSTPTLQLLVEELDQNMEIESEMKSWAIEQIHVSGGAR